MVGKYHFYPAKNSFLMMHLETYPQYSVYHAFLAGGKLDELLELQEQIRPIAKTLGAKYSSISGRPGWVRELKNRGWRHTYSTLYQEI